MVAIVYQTDKRSGITYAYHSVSYWDKEKKQSRARRTLIGRLDSATGEIVPTDGRNRKKHEDTVSVNDRPDAPAMSHRSFYGATYLLDAIGEKLGIAQDVHRCFPDTYQQILSIAYYLILEDSTPLYRFEKWSTLHKHPYGKSITSQRSSEVFATITEEAKQRFFTLQGKRRLEQEFWAYDTTSLSSYSETLRQVQYGYNKEHDLLPQLKLALVFGQESNLPFYYRKLAGNILDSKTIRHLLTDLDLLGCSRIKLVMDRGFYSEANINCLYRDHVKFLMSVKMSLSFVRNELDGIYDTFRSFEQYNEDYELYCRTVRTTWKYAQKRPYKGDTLQEPRRLYIHYYYNIAKAAEDEQAFDRRLLALKQELETGERVPEHEKLYQKYFLIRTTPKRGTHVTIREEVISKARRYYGFFALITNETMDAVTALELYRTKDVVEKAFGNLKERLSMRRALVSSEQSLDGKLFVQFVALIYLSYIKKQMQVKGLLKDYTLSGVLDKLDLIECFEQPGKALRVGEMLDAQRQLYLDLGIDPPTSL
ncbi:IS1634 family transposase [Methanoculleus sp. FWC-SCC1]|uniref:IS1634 family transposase n=1 Tax=Methanoculleus frigidifontis TaxID=2584085 RepID=A0ABT8M7E1_9EURY|nr:IS1634 family transposase [Methanoculleus sp. FWC-SCC1]MDN7023845.1 IS1634 family transposase [Methanoculleus sp. FWC-SCC1]